MMGFLVPVAVIILLGAFLTTAMAYFILQSKSIFLTNLCRYFPSLLVTVHHFR